ncbi:MAG: flagellar filament capping protein FliD [Pirellulales bacterium]|nr:flagellar filament capping protein FliD [Pirellulales bacterium]
MGRITSSVGLVSGIPTQDIIDQLIGLQAGRKTTVDNQIAQNTQVQTALSTVSAQLLGLQSSAAAFGSSSVIDAKSATSSDSTVLGVTASESAQFGSFAFRVLGLATTQQLLSDGVADTDVSPVGAGTISIKSGGFVDETASLTLLNGGSGIARGEIRVTDADGKSAIVDLSNARTVADVVDAINSTSAVDILASVTDDAFVLTDQSGGAGSVSVDEVNLGSTAADLGLATGTLSGGGSILTGSDVVSVGDLTLSALNDGLGVRHVEGLDDFRIDLRDGTTSLNIDVSSATTLSDVVDLINNHEDNGGLLTASIAADGKRIELNDTSGGGTLSITALNASDAAYDLGLGSIVDGGGLLSGGRIVSGLSGPLLRNINGGAGISELGTIRITDRSGASADIDLSGVETLNGAIDAINASGIDVSARINDAANGILIEDTSGSTASDLIIADLATGTFAADLNFAGSYSTDSAGTGDVNHRFISHNTSLDDLNGGQAIFRGRIQITDSFGVSSEIDLTAAAGNNIETVGDLIDAIHSGSANVSARINDTGDGLLLVDNAGGQQAISVSDLSGGAAEAIGIAGTGDGQIDGALRYDIEVTDTDTLDDVLEKLQQSGAPLSASVINDGSGVNPFHLLVVSDRSGSAGRLLIDTGTVGIDLNTVTEGRDAVLEFGGAASSGASLLVTSSDNTFDDVLDGVTLTATGISDQQVTVNIGRNSAPLADAINTFVENFNAVRATIEDVTFFDSETETRGILQGNSTVRNIENVLFDIVGRVFGEGAGDIRRLTDLGLTLNNGRLEFDQSVLETQLAADPEGVKSFFDTTQFGAADKIEDLLDSFTSVVDGSITNQVNSINEQNAELEEQSELLAFRLEQERLRLEQQFVQMEIAIARVQSLESTLTQLAQLADSAQSNGE